MNSRLITVPTSSSPHLITIDPRIYCETVNELHSYITSSKRGYLTQAELFRYYRQRHDNAEIPYRLLGYRSLLDLLSSDQRLFAIDLHREPAFVYSAVKLRQQQRERRQGDTSFSRQHHSTNTVDEPHTTTVNYIYFDHHVPINEQIHQQFNESNDEQKPIIDANIRSDYDTNLWHTPPLNEQINCEESVEKPIEHNSDPILCQCQTIQRKIVATDDENSEKKIQHTQESPLPKLQSARLNRSISTSTTSLTKTKCIYFIDWLICLLIVAESPNSSPKPLPVHLPKGRRATISHPTSMPTVGRQPIQTPSLIQNWPNKKL